MPSRTLSAAAASPFVLTAYMLDALAAADLRIVRGLLPFLD
jgi:hypothetical protein